jgi:ribosomal protein L37AE/L43A
MTANRSHRNTPLCAVCGKRPAVSLMRLKSGRTSAKYRQSHDLCRQCRRSSLDAAYARARKMADALREYFRKGAA